ncbi:MAG TPA: UDP-3-O-(3-hydroxymyristoyl)glucosamine N-acyltransferase [bacterium]|nr:UDP-3-O-(3-hydroxymyristoyl)glucosamine N-acyltransferase [bacterium]HMZ05409.1 UDP-3-O-(3-hydroxymyristoyl)glucosamine N-acyltransferase [bacterium]HNC49954.1 UDP-3-O-(3-hydroxymyristoyl)glucosamine N-acyltransferase [bacterium]HND77164.1 UDP-3-O-(3-hydroxymyristoyl)glucosamine N-acyltransferase [bacterium]HNF86768.1 UDP-3-O-(3-hydroxymyristoyl)glucosamine N-acyltransferase [bacterium]
MASRSYKFSDIAKLLERPFVGSDSEITGFNEPMYALESEVIFLFQKNYVPQSVSGASKFWIVSEKVFAKDLAEQCLKKKTAYILSKDPYEDIIKVLTWWIDQRALRRGNAFKIKSKLYNGVKTHRSSVIGYDTIIGRGTLISAHAVIGNHVRIGKGCVIYPNVSIYDNTIIGDRVIIHAGSVIGSDGFGFHKTEEGYLKIPHIGRVVVGDDVEIGANCCIDRGTVGETKIGRGCKLDNLIQIGHNVIIGPHTLIAAQAGVAGSTRIGDHVTIAGQAGLVGHINIGDHAVIAAQAGVIGSVDENTTVSGYPAREHRAALRRDATLKKIIEQYDQKDKV